MPKSKTQTHPLTCCAAIACGLCVVGFFACGGVLTSIFSSSNATQAKRREPENAVAHRDDRQPKEQQENARAARIAESREQALWIAKLPRGAERDQRGQEWMTRYADCVAVRGGFEQQARFWQAIEEMEAIGKIQNDDARKLACERWIAKYPDLMANLNATIESAAAEQAAMRGATKPAGSIHVQGYTRKDGTYVRPHDRAAPGSGGSHRRR